MQQAPLMGVKLSSLADRIVGLIHTDDAFGRIVLCVPARIRHGFLPRISDGDSLSTSSICGRFRAASPMNRTCSPAASGCWPAVVSHPQTAAPASKVTRVNAVIVPHNLDPLRFGNRRITRPRCRGEWTPQK